MDNEEVSSKSVFEVDDKRGERGVGVEERVWSGRCRGSVRKVRVLWHQG